MASHPPNRCPNPGLSLMVLGPVFYPRSSYPIYWVLSYDQRSSSIQGPVLDPLPYGPGSSLLILDPHILISNELGPLL